jgi:hypothetical protein
MSHKTTLQGYYARNDDGDFFNTALVVWNTKKTVSCFLPAAVSFV